MNYFKLLLVVLTAQTAYSQMYFPLGMDTEYNTIIEKKSNYFDSLRAEGVPVDSLSEYKQFKRMYFAHQYNQGFPNYTMNDIKTADNTWLAANESIWGCTINTVYPFLNFQEIGPQEHTLHKYSDSTIEGTGQIHYITIDPADPDKLFACSNYGGLFRTDLGDFWSNAGTDSGLPFTSVSSVALSPTDDDTWFVTTGTGEAYGEGAVGMTDIGIWRTTDGGLNYECISGSGFGPAGVDLHTSPRTRKIIATGGLGSTRLIVASGNGLFVCFDGEAATPAWEKIADGIFYDVEITPNDLNIIYGCGDKDTPLIMYDFTLEIATAISDLNFDFDFEDGDKRRASIEFCHEEEDFLFIVITEQDTNSAAYSTLHRYKISSDSFTHLGVLPPGSSDAGQSVGFERAMAWDVSNSYIAGEIHMVYGNVRQIRFSDDLLADTIVFADWIQIMEDQIHDDQHFMKFYVDGAIKLMVGNDGGIFKTTMQNPSLDYNSYSWESLNTGLSVNMSQTVSTSQNGERLIMGSFFDISNMMFTQDSAFQWNSLGVGPRGDGTEDLVNVFDSDKSLATNQNAGIAFTKNRWENRNYYNLTALIDTIWGNKIVADASNQEEIYMATANGLFKGYHGSDAADLHSLLPIEASISPENGYTKPQLVYEVWTTENQQFSDYIYVLWMGGKLWKDDAVEIIPARIYRSTDGGGADSSKWELVYTFESNGFGTLAINYDDPNIFYVSESDSLYKVDLNSTDPDDWRQDYTAGLPTVNHAAIRDIQFVNGSSNEALYVGTKHGLYYRDDTRYSTGFIHVCGLPNTQIYDLEIDYCLNKLIVATWGRGLWEAQIEIPEKSHWVINSNTTIDSEHFINTDIIIEDGTLTVKDTLFMAEGTNIIVKQGARLKIDGGTITNACGRFWNGIQVWGSDSLAQNYTNQGAVIMVDSATIENAIVGVALWKPGSWASTGGIIQASNSTFKNNKKDVEFRKYQNHNPITNTSIPNISYFNNVEFTWDDDLRVEFPLGHVTLYYVDGVRFSACNFNDMRTNPESRYFHDKGKTNSGIYSVDAQYFVIASCPLEGDCTGTMMEGDWTPTTFTNLDFGIYAANSSSDYNIDVDRCFFKNNLYGVQIVGVNGATITRNAFGYTNESNNFVERTQQGIHLVRSQNFEVEENIFIRDDATGAINGIVASDLGEANNDIYKNSFFELDNGIITQGKNRNYNDIEFYNGRNGLQFLCNSNMANYRDHLVLGTLWNIDTSDFYGVRRDNGAFESHSGNAFSESYYDYEGEDYENNSSHGLLYYFTDTIPNHTPVETIGEFVSTPAGNPNECLSELTENPYQQYLPAGITILKSDFADYSDVLQLKQANFDDLINGGNTDSLMTAVSNLTITNQNAIRQLLLDFSPYVTGEIILETIDNSATVFPHAWAYELIVENIEAAYEPGFIDFLSSKSVPMPTWMIQEIEAKVDSSLYTDMRVKRSEISLLQYQLSGALSKILVSVKNDTSGINIDSLYAWSNQLTIELKEFNLVDILMQSENYSSAQSIVNTLNTNQTNYSQHLQAEIDDYIDFKTKMITLFSNNTDMDSLSIADHSYISDIATNGTGLARYQAQELLCFFFNECDEYPVVVNGQQQTLSPVQEEEKERIGDRQFIIYPNPANSWVTIVLPETDEILKMVITDISGKIVHSNLISEPLHIFNTSILTNGHYFITLTNQSSTIDFGTQQLIIQH